MIVIPGAERSAVLDTALEHAGRLFKLLSGLAKELEDFQATAYRMVDKARIRSERNRVAELSSIAAAINAGKGDLLFFVEFAGEYEDPELAWQEINAELHAQVNRLETCVNLIQSSKWLNSSLVSEMALHATQTKRAFEAMASWSARAHTDDIGRLKELGRIFRQMADIGREALAKADKYAADLEAR